ncbi:MAG: sigma-54 dependent transcriptional regulator [Myxococcota bacterium]|nr:sigma-54 dependent transcriptional regulator [Myxococcota bacterium]
MKNPRILVVDDEESIRHMLSLSLSKDGFQVWCASSGQEALSILQRGEKFQFCVTDVRMPGMDGLALIEEAQILGKAAPTFIAMSAYGDKQLALEALRRGAFDYISKPFEPAELTIKLGLMMERTTIAHEKKARPASELTTTRKSSAIRLKDVVMNAPSMKAIARTIEKVASFPTTLLLTGETGTGKEIIANALHSEGSRRNKPFVAVNCAAIPENLIESELFGHLKGAFTDASEDRIGLFEQAHEGTILLDEIGELSVPLQVKLLRVLVEDQIRPVGSTKSKVVDVRVVAATSRNLEQRVRSGDFREDLYHRLNVITIHVPPLRQRKEDVPGLAAHFCKKFERRLGLDNLSVQPEAMEKLKAYKWPGNVRELENALERAFVLSDRRNIGVTDLDDRFFGDGQSGLDDGNGSSDELENLNLKIQISVLEKKIITRALKRSKGNRNEAAKLLGVSPRTLLYKIKDYGLS